MFYFFGISFPHASIVRVCLYTCTHSQLQQQKNKQSMKKIRSWTFRSRFEFVFPVFLLAQAIRFVVGVSCVRGMRVEVQSVVLDDVGVMPKCGARIPKRHNITSIERQDMYWNSNGIFILTLRSSIKYSVCKNLCGLHSNIQRGPFYYTGVHFCRSIHCTKTANVSVSDRLICAYIYI